MNKTAIILSIVMVFTGCGRKTDTPQVSPVPMESPEAVVVKAVTAMHSCDRQAFLECFSVSQSEYSVLEAILQAGEVFSGFKADFIKAYGKEEWDRFQDPNQAPDGADMSLTFVTSEEVERARQWRPEGDAPHFQFPNTHGPTVITKQGTGWIIQFGEMLGNPSEEELSQFVEMMLAMRDLVTKYSNAIGTEGISGEDIDFQMGKDMMGMVFGIGLKAPDRFDIDEIIKQNK
jgi:hypothetical protein